MIQSDIYDLEFLENEHLLALNPEIVENLIDQKEIPPCISYNVKCDTKKGFKLDMLGDHDDT